MLCSEKPCVGSVAMRCSQHATSLGMPSFNAVSRVCRTNGSSLPYDSKDLSQSTVHLSTC